MYTGACALTPCEGDTLKNLSPSGTTAMPFALSRDFIARAASSRGSFPFEEKFIFTFGSPAAGMATCPVSSSRTFITCIGFSSTK